MWRTPNGKVIFTGPYAMMLAHGIKKMTDRLQNELMLGEAGEEDEVFESGHIAFDNLTTGQKIWTLHTVAFGLLDDTPACELTAPLEATIASIFRILEESIDLEIEAKPSHYAAGSFDDFFWRRVLHNVYEFYGYNSPEELNGDDPLILECSENQQWYIALETLEKHVLWGATYDLESIDDMPQELSERRMRLRITEKYFSSIPNDPQPNVAEKLLKATAKLCAAVCERESEAATAGLNRYCKRSVSIVGSSRKTNISI